MYFYYDAILLIFSKSQNKQVNVWKLLGPDVGQAVGVLDHLLAVILKL